MQSHCSNITQWTLQPLFNFHKNGSHSHCLTHKMDLTPSPQDCIAVLCLYIQFMELLLQFLLSNPLR